jgi:hypothetical protein
MLVLPFHVVVGSALALGHPVPHLRQPLTELGRKERVLVDGGQVDKEGLVVRDEPEQEL